MSKAFTKDDGDAADPLDAAPQQRPSGPRYLTAEGFARLEAELATLRADLPPASGADPGARRAAARRIRQLARVLADATVVAPRACAEAFFGAWVTVEDEDGARTTYRLVGPDEANGAAGLVSVASPLGAALLGKRADDEVTVRRPAGPVVLLLVAVQYSAPHQG